MNNSPITIRGNLTEDPELTGFASGAQKAQFNVAVNHRYRKNEDWVEDVSFITVVAWSYLAENAEKILTKGMAVIVTGRMTQRSYETDDKQRRYVYELLAEDIGPSVNRLESVVRSAPRATAGATSSPQPTSEPYGPEEAPW